jgi:hypothetical protein
VFPASATVPIDDEIVMLLQQLLQQHCGPSTAFPLGVHTVETTVARTLVPTGGGAVDCGATPGTCSIVVAGIASLSGLIGVAAAPITFGGPTAKRNGQVHCSGRPNFPATRVRIAVSPKAGIDRASVLATDPSGQWVQTAVTATARRWIVHLLGPPHVSPTMIQVVTNLGPTNPVAVAAGARRCGG